MPDIDQQKYQLQLFGFMQIIFDHLTPLGFHMLIGLCIAVARQIYKVDFIVNVVIIDGLCLARLGTGPGQRLTVHQSVDQRGFADITFPGEATSGCIFSGSLLVIPQTVSRLTFFMIIKTPFLRCFCAS